MRKLTLVAVLLLVATLPFTASAQPRPPGPPAAPAPSGEVMLNVSKLVTIGAGVIIGAVVLEALAAGDAAVLAGGLLGGFIGAWWYDNNQGDGMPRMMMRQSAAMTVASPNVRPIPSF